MLIETLLNDTGWKTSDVQTPNGPGTLRYRAAVPPPSERAGYHSLLIAIWSYADEGSGEMPDTPTTVEMDRFEMLLRKAVEADGQALLAAVQTFDGVRQWTFYTRDVDEFAKRLGAMPNYHGQHYPIELATDEDPNWKYLLEHVVPAETPAP